MTKLRKELEKDLGKSRAEAGRLDTYDDTKIVYTTTKTFYVARRYGVWYMDEEPLIWCDNCNAYCYDQGEIDHEEDCHEEAFEEDRLSTLTYRTDLRDYLQKIYTDSCGDDNEPNQLGITLTYQIGESMPEATNVLKR